MPNAAQIHLLVNHVPVLAPVCAVVLAALSLVWKRDGLVHAALVLLVVGALGGVAANLSGHPAEHVLEDVARGISHTTIHRHEDAAEWAWIGGALVGLAALFAAIRFRRTVPAWLPAATLAVALALSAWMGWVAHLGGEIRHPEIRTPESVQADSLADVARRLRRQQERAAPESAPLQP